jgi:hypothetical protein
MLDLTPVQNESQRLTGRVLNRSASGIASGDRYSTFALAVFGAGEAEAALLGLGDKGGRISVAEET